MKTGKLRGYGEGRTQRLCPVCGSKDGRVGTSLDGTNRRGWLCFACGYFPGKDPKACLLNKRIAELDVEKAEASVYLGNN